MKIARAVAPPSVGRMFIVATHSNFENRSVGVRCFVGLRRYISLLRSLPRAFNTGAINIASLRDWVMIGLFGALCTVPAIAQRNGVRRPDTPSQTVGDGLTSSAKNSLDAAVAALQSNALVEAERQARAAVTASPRSAVTHNVLGVVLDRSGRSDEAFKEFTVAIRLDPNFISARNNLGRMLATHGKRTEAIAEFERVLKADPNHIQAHYNLGALYADAGDFAKAAAHFASARQADANDPQLALAFLNVAYRANRLQEADMAADLVERAAGSDAKSIFTLAPVLAEAKQYERAARLFARVNELTPHMFEVLYDLGIALYNLDRNQEAERYLAEAADLNPGPPETHFRLALIASALNDTANSVLEFKHAIERDPKNPNFHFMLAREYSRIGYWDGAIEENTTAIEINPKEAAYVYARANANYRKAEWTAAAADFDRAGELDPKIENIEYLRGYAHRAAGDFEKAREILERFVATHADHIDALSSLGYVAIEQGRLDDAEAPLRHALQLAPDEVPVLYDYARLALKRRDYPEAIARLEKVIGRLPTLTQAHYQLFLAYSRLKQTDKAQAELAEFKRLEALEKQVERERILDEKLRTQQLLGQSPK